FRPPGLDVSCTRRGTGCLPTRGGSDSDSAGRAKMSVSSRTDTPGAPGVGDRPDSVHNPHLLFVAQLIGNGSHPPMAPASPPLLGVDPDGLFDADANNRTPWDWFSHPE